MNNLDSNAGGHTGIKYRLGYRPEIEGLRAIAILLVIAAHAGLPGLAGGFVGVDVFFVLSGYLITGLLIQEIHETGSVALAGFYTRRLLRLMPALLLMTCVTSVVGWFFLPVAEQSGQALSAAAAVLWLSNLLFAFQQMDYFSPGSESNLFLHTWSLGVEEQFYIVWPVLLIFALGMWRSSPDRPKFRVLGASLWLVIAASFALGIYWLSAHPTFAFYMMPARVWQFALGALVFLYFGAPDFQLGSSESRPRLSWLVGWTGLALILSAALLLDKNTPYPGAWALLPSAGAALALIPTRHASFIATNHWLSARPLQAIGRVSYSWYLWHWPALLLGAAVVNMHSAWNRAALVLLSLSIAAASWRYFELPLRRQRQLLARPRMTVFVSLAIMVLSGSLALRWGAAADTRAQHPDYLQFQAARTDAPQIYAMGCDDWYLSADVSICSFGSETATYTAVVMGDSIGLQWFPAYAKVFSSPDWRLLVITKSACPMVDIPIFYSRIGRMYTECTEWRDSALETVAALSPNIAILGSSHNYDYTPTQWEQGTQRVLRRLVDSVDRIYIMHSTPTLPFNGPSCLEPRNGLHDYLRSTRFCAAPAYSSRNQRALDALKEAVIPFPNTYLLDLTEDVCPNGICEAQRNGQVVFRDGQHLTASFAETLATSLAAKLRINRFTSEAKK